MLVYTMRDASPYKGRLYSKSSELYMELTVVFFVFSSQTNKMGYFARKYREKGEDFNNNIIFIHLLSV
jgi:hypothetical protein